MRTFKRQLCLLTAVLICTAGCQTSNQHNARTHVMRPVVNEVSATATDGDQTSECSFPGTIAHSTTEEVTSDTGKATVASATSKPPPEPEIQLVSAERGSLPEVDSTDASESQPNVDVKESPEKVDESGGENNIQTVAATSSADADDAFPVDLPTVLRLAGGQNWAVQLAWERINQAEANVDAAELLWVPNLNVGVAATQHEGRIQATSGQIVDVSRNSLFVGAGAKIADAPLAGGAGGPARLAVDLSIADALFKPLVARQLSCAARSRHAVEFNNAQLEAALAYFDLVAAQGEMSITGQNLEDARSLQTMTEAFVSAGRASNAEVSRVAVIVANQQQDRIAAELKLKLASTELIRVVRLDPSQLPTHALLYSADDHLIPLELVPENSKLNALIVQGQRARPEVAEHYSLAEAERAAARSQELRPFLPHLNLGVSGGAFGGGVGSNIGNLNGRSDVDAMLVWEVRNLGLGERAARREAGSRYRQRVLSAHQIQDQIAADVRSAWHQVNAGRQQFAVARQNVEDASRVLELNLERIRGLEGLPLEAIQALNAVSDSRMTLLQTIVRYNRAQASLLRAIGRPVSRGLQAG